MPDSDLLAESLLAVISECWRTQAFGTFAELGIADLILDGENSTEKLAFATKSELEPLRRLLRASIALGLVSEGEEDQFLLTDLGKLLSTDSPNSLRNWTLWWAKELWPVWGELSHSVRTGKSARERLYGTAGFAHLEQDGEKAKIFHNGLAEITRIAARDIVRCFDFSRFPVVMDLGGGYGQLLAEILRCNSKLKGILFDLPIAIQQAPVNLGDSSLSNRVQMQTGDFFQEVPSHADAIILKSVIHDWAEPDALRILAICRRDMKPGSKLLLIERMAGNKPHSDDASRMKALRDLTMLVAHGAQERTENEYRGLLEKSDFKVEGLTHTHSGFSILEAV